MNIDARDYIQQVGIEIIKEIETALLQEKKHLMDHNVVHQTCHNVIIGKIIFLIVRVLIINVPEQLFYNKQHLECSSTSSFPQYDIICKYVKYLILFTLYIYIYGHSISVHSIFFNLFLRTCPIQQFESYLQFPSGPPLFLTIHSWNPDTNNGVMLSNGL